MAILFVESVKGNERGEINKEIRPRTCCQSQNRLSGRKGHLRGRQTGWLHSRDGWLARTTAPPPSVPQLTAGLRGPAGLPDGGVSERLEQVISVAGSPGRSSSHHGTQQRRLHADGSRPGSRCPGSSGAGKGLHLPFFNVSCAGPALFCRSFWRLSFGSFVK